MNTIRPCGCKGCRTCLLCENEFGIDKKDFQRIYKQMDPYVYCPDCERLYPGWDINKVLKNHNNHKIGEGLKIPGILVKQNFLVAEEAQELTKKIDEIPWQGSQSGRRKQNFGPKTNFKKKKLQNGDFNGFPKFSQFVQKKFSKEALLEGFQTIEQCTLEYDPNKGASIDPHIDDCWIWGERVVTVNCLGDSVLTLVKYNGKSSKYNLDLVDQYQSQLVCDLFSEEELKAYDNMVIRIPMPNLSLIVLFGPARYQFEHTVLREDVSERRICLAHREFTPMYLEGGEDYIKGKAVTEKAALFWDHEDNYYTKNYEIKA